MYSSRPDSSQGPQHLLPSLVRRVGAWAMRVVRHMGRMGIFLGQAVGTMLTTPLKLDWLGKRIQFIG